MVLDLCSKTERVKKVSTVVDAFFVDQNDMKKYNVVAFIRNKNNNVQCQ